MKLYGTSESREPCNLFNASHNPHFLSLWKRVVLSIERALVWSAIGGIHSYIGGLRLTPWSLLLWPRSCRCVLPNPVLCLGPVRVSVAIREPSNNAHLRWPLARCESRWKTVLSMIPDKPLSVSEALRDELLTGRKLKWKTAENN